MRYEFIKNKNLLSSQARIQVPWVKVTIGDYTFGIFDEKTKSWISSSAEMNKEFSIQFPQFINALEVIKINGQVNQYTLSIVYPITIDDDPNFFEKVFSSVSRTRKIIFTYGDAENPAYVYKNEEAIITNINQSFDLKGSSIAYTINAVSSIALAADGSITVPATGEKVKPSAKIKEIFRTNKSLQNTFTGMSSSDLDTLIDSSDASVYIESKQNISAIDYINYLVGCMIPDGELPGLSKEIYSLTIYDDSNTNTNQAMSRNGPYFDVKKVSTVAKPGQVYEIDIGINTSTIVRNFTIDKNENYSIYYEYQNAAHPENYVRRINNDGLWEDVFAPTRMARENKFDTKASDSTWWTKVTKFPVNASITVQGLLRPATLMQYVKLNVIFPGGHKHQSSGIYIVTRQTDNISPDGYTTTLGLTRIMGDDDTI